MTVLARSRAVLLLARELGLEALDAEVLEAFAVSASGPRDLILFSIALSLCKGAAGRGQQNHGESIFDQANVGGILR